jgi:hypothetical protein
MTELNPQERFDQLLSFLKDPKNQTYKRSKNFSGIWSLSFPNLSLEDSIWLEGREHSAATVQDVQQEAVEIMESGMFRQGSLKGNRRTPDIPVTQLEKFILQVAAAVRLAKWHKASSPDFRFADFDRRPQLYDELKTICEDLERAYSKWVNYVLKHELISPDKLGFGKQNLEIIEGINQLQHEGRFDEIDPYIRNHSIRERVGHKLIKLMADSLYEAYRKEDEMSFDLVEELIRIFLANIPKAPNSLIAYHISKFINERSKDSLKDFPSLWQDTVRKQVEKEREHAFIILAT